MRQIIDQLVACRALWSYWGSLLFQTTPRQTLSVLVSVAFSLSAADLENVVICMGSMFAGGRGVLMVVSSGLF